MKETWPHARGKATEGTLHAAVRWEGIRRQHVAAEITTPAVEEKHRHPAEESKAEKMDHSREQGQTPAPIRGPEGTYIHGW